MELLCDRVVIIDRGRIVAQGTPESLREKWVGNPGLRVALKDSADGAALAAFGRIDGVTGVHARSEDGVFVLDCASGADVREEVFRAAVANGWVLLEMTRERATLEDVFVRLTTHDSASSHVSEQAPETCSRADSEETVQ